MVDTHRYTGPGYTETFVSFAAHLDRLDTYRIGNVGDGEHMYSICVGSVAARPPPATASASPAASAESTKTTPKTEIRLREVLSLSKVNRLMARRVYG